jgi:hypothetical protein
VAVADHWSYIGIGWTAGIESCAASLRDAISLAESDVRAKTSVNFDAYAYERLKREYPYLIDTLKRKLDEKQLDIVGGSFGQPLASTISGESNLRQLLEGLRTIREAVGYEVETFLEQEEFSHPQVPQLLVGSGYRYASLAQSDTWGRQGVPTMDVPVVDWVGADGTAIRATTRNSLCFHTWPVDWRAVLEFSAVARHDHTGTPLILKWEEFGWDKADFADANALVVSLRELAQLADVRFVTLAEYLDGWQGPTPEVTLMLDDWRRLLAWGIGGDQLRRAERQTEPVLLAAETLDVLATFHGAPSHRSRIATAWRNLLAAQSHDAALCEYTVGVPATPPLSPIEDRYNASWGSIAFAKLRCAQAEARSVCSDAMTELTDPSPTGDERSLAVFNTTGFGVTEVVRTPRLDELPDGTTAVLVYDPDGAEVPSQLVDQAYDAHGSLIAAQVLFRAELGPLSAAAYRLVPHDQPPSSSGSVSLTGLSIANEFVTIELDPVRGGIARLVTSDGLIYMGDEGPTPVFTGNRNAQFPLTGVLHHLAASDASMIATNANLGEPAGHLRYDSAMHSAVFDVLERGPVRATIRCTTAMPLARLETVISLDAGSPEVHMTVRILAAVPPDPAIERGDGRWAPANYPADGYWLSFHTHFPVRRIVRDAPFLVQETESDRFEALGFVDLVGDDRALLLAHGGTQHFRHDSTHVLSNLVMREWESYFGSRYGWPPVAQYAYKLVPHELEWTNLQRRAASSLFSPLSCCLRKLRHGRIVYGRTSGSVELTCLRVADDDRIEARVVEYDGVANDVEVSLEGMVGRFTETDHRGVSLPATASPTTGVRGYGIHTLRSERGSRIDEDTSFLPVG